MLITVISDPTFSVSTLLPWDNGHVQIQNIALDGISDCLAARWNTKFPGKASGTEVGILVGKVMELCHMSVEPKDGATSF